MQLATEGQDLAHTVRRGSSVSTGTTVLARQNSGPGSLQVYCSLHQSIQIGPGPSRLLVTRSRGLFFWGYSGRGGKLFTQIHLVPEIQQNLEAVVVIIAVVAAQIVVIAAVVIIVVVIVGD